MRRELYAYYEKARVLGGERLRLGSRAGRRGHLSPTTDDAMTRSEEELRVGNDAARESGRARLRKYVVTEQVEMTVPVQREEVRVEREPITDANVGEATAGPDISEEEHEVVLHEERRGRQARRPQGAGCAGEEGHRRGAP